ncbi:MAG: IS110 family transposase [bacterium]
MKQNKYLNFKNLHIYVGLDVHQKSWVVSIHTEKIFHDTFTQDPVPSILINYLKRNFPKGIYHSVYEAGFSGFWIHDELKAGGVDSIVINPADVPTTNKERDRKTDKVDSLKLSRSLRNGELAGIYIHDRNNYEDRTLLRARESLVKDQTRIKNRIKGLLKFFGIEITQEQVKTHWSRRFIELLENTGTINSGAKISLNMYLEQLKSQRKILCDTTREIRKLSTTDKFKEDVKHLISIPGISILSAMTLLTEIGDISRFTKLDKFLSYIGLIPSEHSSGEKVNQKYMTRRGNSSLRRIIVESSWTAVRKDPGLLKTFNKICKRHKKSRAIITIARKYAARIMHVLKQKEEYKFLAVK